MSKQGFDQHQKTESSTIWQDPLFMTCQKYLFKLTAFIYCLKFYFKSFNFSLESN